MIIQTLCNIFKLNLLKGLEDFDPASSSVYNIALYDSTANLNADTSAYTTTNEVVGTGYTAGGKTLTKVPPSLDGATAIVTFGNVSWDPARFTARGALIYNAVTGAAVAVLNFGDDKTAVSTFPISFPVANSNTAIIRIA